MRKKLLFLEIVLILSLVLDYSIHYLSTKMANLIFILILMIAFYLFKPYFIWTDLVKRGKERQNKDKDTMPR